MANEQKVRVYLGTRKGGYVAESDRKRAKWTVSGPFQEGTDVFHVAPDPRKPGVVYSLSNSGWFGPRMFRSKNFGKTWTEIAPPGMTTMDKRPPATDPSNPPGKDSPIVNLWHLEPGPASEPNTVFLGIDPAKLFRSDDQGDSWIPMNGLNDHETRPKWNPGAGGMCLHTILIDPTNPKRMYVGISAAGTFRSDDAGDHWRPVNKGVLVSFQPEKAPIVGQCVHKVAFEPSNPETLYRQDHDGIHVSRDGMESWQRVGKVLETDFGFVVTAPRAMPGGAFFVPLNGAGRTAPGHQLQIYRWTEKTKKFTPTVKGNPFPGDLGCHRDAFASDALDPAGLYLGTTTGQLIFSNDGAKSYREIPFRFPSIHSVTVLSPNEGR